MNNEDRDGVSDRNDNNDTYTGRVTNRRVELKTLY